MIDIGNIPIFLLVFALIAATVFHFLMIKDNPKDTIGVSFIVLSLIVGLIFSVLFMWLLPLSFLLSDIPREGLGALSRYSFGPATVGRADNALAIFMVLHTFLTLITYWFALRHDMSDDANPSRFLRTKKVILFIFVFDTIFAIMPFINLDLAKPIILVPITGLPFSAIAFVVFMSMVAWRRKVDSAKVWRPDAILILVTSPLLLLISAFALGLILRIAFL